MPALYWVWQLDALSLGYPPPRGRAPGTELRTCKVVGRMQNSGGGTCCVVMIVFWDGGCVPSCSYTRHLPRPLLSCSICTFTNIQTRDITVTVTMTMTVHITLTISLFVTASVCQKHFLSLLPKLEVEKILNYKVVFLLHLSSRSTSSLVCIRTLFLELWGICPHD